MRNFIDLEKLLVGKLNGKGYKAYKDLTGEIYGENGIELKFEYVQGDPFASPSKICVTVDEKTHKFPRKYFENNIRSIAFRDYLTRVVSKNIFKVYDRVKGSGKSGMILIDKPGQEVIDRTSIKIERNRIQVRMEVGLPAFGRKIAGKEAADMLSKSLVKIIKDSISCDKINSNHLESHIKLAEDQEYIRKDLRERGYVAFISNGAILPRESGISQRPMKNGVTAFESPKEMEIEIKCPHHGNLKGMGIKEGITLVVGGGYHGKSTLLRALELGVYNHVSGDGREFVISDDTSVKVRAEDGRKVEKVDISTFINNLPNKKDTVKFESENASGSTSQAANIIEAIESGSRTLLIDEDTSATNFMIRDEKMKMLIHKDKEPITPFIDRVRSLYSKHGISSILVIGSSGEYFHKADSIIMLDEYRVFDITKRAKDLFKTDVAEDESVELKIKTDRVINNSSFPRFDGKSKIKSKGLHSIIVNRDEIDLAFVEQLIDTSQTNCIKEIMKYSAKHLIDGKRSLKDILEALDRLIDSKGLEAIASSKGHPGNLARPRRYEIMAAFNRYRNLKIK